MIINKDTKIYCSFSTNPGNNGCLFFNDAFKKYNINALYKSFYSDDIEMSVKSVKHLEFGGFAVSMPHKIKILDYLDEYDSHVLEIGACNTVVVKDKTLYGYNTDWVGVDKYLPKNINNLTILGNGGFSLAVQHVCKIRGINFTVITRDDWHLVKDLKGIIFNTTPIDVETKGNVIEARTDYESGKTIAKLQSIEQFKIYTGIEYV